ncbi:DUF2169 family type VI secretion system accessory protein [Duganella levis]|uniref:DUF2169 domain-containing protein n=1 Tax=Duganella levis TaxID=2692169 RepID=A0ABW9W5Q1_9BURK|nr:DUF2169 domain-containing protein [Duganella levis]MYN29379.1 DUF2169 domain-containing protein [Duganella levis]
MDPYSFPSAAHSPVPGIVFDNRTPHAAIQFDALDQHGAAFHIFVAKIGYRLGPCGADGKSRLTPCDEAVQLNTEDIHVDGNPAASVLEESDLAPFKPRCDVVVNAVAYAPRGIPITQFAVALRVDRRDAGPHDESLIKKQLIVCGQQWFKRSAKLARLWQWPVRVFTLGLVYPPAWYLSSPKKLASLPLRYEFASGGECRIDGDKGLHEACQGNPLGRGFTRSWYLKRLGETALAAPQIFYISQPISARQFQDCAAGNGELQPAGMGPIGRAWMPRRSLIGAIAEKSEWQRNEVPSLPENFDFGYWNCAPFDQQCGYLHGQECLTLTNLCAPDAEAARVDHQGNTVLRFDLPQQAMFVLVADISKRLIVLPLVIDTVIINPQTQRVDLVWRGCLAADGNSVEARLMHIVKSDQIARLDQLIQHQWTDRPQHLADPPDDSGKK